MVPRGVCHDFAVARALTALSRRTSGFPLHILQGQKLHSRFDTWCPSADFVSVYIYSHEPHVLFSAPSSTFGANQLNLVIPFARTF